ncbi:MAG: hypothetical protein ACK5U4_06245 [Rhodospirillales bacterium]
MVLPGLLEAERAAALQQKPARPVPGTSAPVLEVAGLAKRFGAQAVGGECLRPQKRRPVPRGFTAALRAMDRVR